MMEGMCLTAGVSMECHILVRLYGEQKLERMYNYTHVWKACRGRGNERRGKGEWGRVGGR